MKYALITDGIVSQIQPNKQDGFIKVDDSVVCGMIKEGDNFTLPNPTVKSIQQQVDDLESSVTTRNILDSLDGDEYAINEVKKVRAEIAILRAKL